MPISPDRKGNTLCVYVKDNLLERMKKYPEVNWSVICRDGIGKYLDMREELENKLARR